MKTCLTKIDALIAEHVFGHKVRWMTPSISDEVTTIELTESEGYYIYKDEEDPFDYKHIPKYSKSISAAWVVMEAIKNINYEVRIYGHKYCEWVVEFSELDSEREQASTLPLAICLAALKAKGIEIDE